MERLRADCVRSAADAAGPVKGELRCQAQVLAEVSRRCQDTAGEVSRWQEQVARLTERVEDLCRAQAQAAGEIVHVRTDTADSLGNCMQRCEALASRVDLVTGRDRDTAVEARLEQSLAGLDQRLALMNSRIDDLTQRRKVQLQFDRRVEKFLTQWEQRFEKLSAQVQGLEQQCWGGRPHGAGACSEGVLAEWQQQVEKLRSQPLASAASTPRKGTPRKSLPTVLYSDEGLEAPTKPHKPEIQLLGFGICAGATANSVCGGYGTPTMTTASAPGSVNSMATLCSYCGGGCVHCPHCGSPRPVQPVVKPSSARGRSST